MTQIQMHPAYIGGQYVYSEELYSNDNGDINLDIMNLDIIDLEQTDAEYGIEITLESSNKNQDTFAFIRMTPDEAELFASTIHKLAEIANRKNQDYQKE